MKNTALHNRPCQLYVASLRLNASLDHRAVLQEAIDSACMLAGAHYGLIAIRDDGQVVDCRLSGMTDGEEPKFCHQPGWMTFFGNIGRSAAPVSLDDFERCIDSLDLSEWRTGTENGHSAGFLLVPLLHRGVPVGHLYIGEKKGGGKFTQGDGEILETFAVQAAMAIENARMYRAEQRARADLAALVDASSAGVLVFDLNSGELLSANAEARRIVSFVGGPGRNIDQTLEVLTLLPAGEPDISSQEIPLARVRTTGETVETAEMIVRTPDGDDLTALVNVRSIRSERGTNRRADYNSGTGATQFHLHYTALAGDDDDGITMVEDGFALIGWSTGATDAATEASLDDDVLNIRPPSFPGVLP